MPQGPHDAGGERLHLIGPAGASREQTGRAGSADGAVDPDEAVLQRYFEDMVAAEAKIEPRDWMPEAYRSMMVRQIAQHAHSELMGMQPESNWLSRAPSLRRKTALLAKVQDEAGHAMYLYAAAETLGVTRRELLDQLHDGRQHYSVVFNFPAASWADIGAIGWLLDGAAIANQVPLCRCSYGPYARAMVRICKEESFHQRQGYSILHTLSGGTPAQHRMAQQAVDRWWYRALALFGLPDRASRNTSRSMAWKIKRLTNDEVRQKFVDVIAEQVGSLGLTLPDQALRFDAERGHWDFTLPDFDALSAVLQGYGPCNRQRMERRRRTHDEGAWVRESALAHAEKQRRRRAG
jgi:ring-1,2-phenylacetyl-CoA epoxidase subunit PaaA